MSEEQDMARTVADLRAKLRNVISHATGGHCSEPKCVDWSLNEIGVRISQHHNRIWQHAQEVAARNMSGPSHE